MSNRRRQDRKVYCIPSSSPTAARTERCSGKRIWTSQNILGKPPQNCVSGHWVSGSSYTEGGVLYCYKLVQISPMYFESFPMLPPPQFSPPLGLPATGGTAAERQSGGRLWCAANSGGLEAQSWDSLSWPICIPKSPALPFCVRNNTGFLPSSRRTNFPWKYPQGKNHWNSFSLFPPFRAI